MKGLVVWVGGVRLGGCYRITSCLDTMTFFVGGAGDKLEERKIERKRATEY